MFNLKFRERHCVLTNDAIKDMNRHDVSEEMVRTIILYGEDYRDERTRKNEFGRALTTGKYLVFVKMIDDYSIWMDSPVWLVKHVGVKKR
jgi:hypothetical protein